jgi:tRNA dimethylallyltransferase
MPSKYIVSIQGPTASGKSDLALFLAKHFDTEIISADSRQFFTEMCIGTAKPSNSEQLEVKHHFVDFLATSDKYSAYDFEQQALSVISSLHNINKIPILVGGSGLYIDAVIKGFNAIPDSDPVLRKELYFELQTSGLSRVLEKLESLDPEYYNIVDRSNPRRVLRALEVCIGSGIPFSKFLNIPKVERSFKTIRIGISYPMDELYQLINLRCDSMLKNGLIDEVSSLIEKKHLPALQTIGYSEFFPYFINEITLDFAIEKFKQHSRNFAKKQMSWLRRDQDIHWFIPPDKKQVLDYINKSIQL